MLEVSNSSNYFTIDKNKGKVRNFDKINIKTFIHFLEAGNWMDVYMSDVNYKFDVFHSTFLYYFNVYFPKVSTLSQTNT